MTVNLVTRLGRVSLLIRIYSHLSTPQLKELERLGPKMKGIGVYSLCIS